MKIAAAQTVPADGDIPLNIEGHRRLCGIAAGEGVDLVLFPEMSLTGYQREAAASIAFVANDSRLARLKEVAVKHRMVIIAGAPILIGDRLYIGAFVLKPDGRELIYTKQFLHSGEESVFAAGSAFDPQLAIGENRFSLAICADITNPVHARDAAAAGSNFYLPGIFYSPGGLSEGYIALGQYSREHNMNILMANYGGPSWGIASGGGSAFWNAAGELVGAIDEGGEGLVIASDEYGDWSVKIISTSELNPSLPKC